MLIIKKCKHLMYLCHHEKGMNDRIVISRMRYVFLKENNVLKLYKKKREHNGGTGKWPSQISWCVNSTVSINCFPCLLVLNGEW